MSNTSKKNNTDINWPTTEYFTTKDLFDKNPNKVHITLRSKLSKRIEEDSVTVIGIFPAKIGRPTNVFAYTPVSKATIDKAVENGMIFPDSVTERVVSPVSINDVSSVISPTKNFASV